MRFVPALRAVPKDMYINVELPVFIGRYFSGISLDNAKE